jgi:hypothetical protein
MAVRKSIRSARPRARPRARPGGHRARTCSVRPTAGRQSVSELPRPQHISSDEELLLQVVKLALRLQVVRRTTLLIQQRLLYAQCDQHGDMTESLRVAVCDPLAVLTRLSEEIAERLGGQGVLEPPA